MPRGRIGVNEYIYALSLRHPTAAKCAPRRLLLQAAPSSSAPALHPTQARAHEPSPRRDRAHGRYSACAQSRWEIDAAAADLPLRVLTIKLHQQYEAPAAVVATVCGTPLDFDAMATAERSPT